MRSRLHVSEEFSRATGYHGEHGCRRAHREDAMDLESVRIHTAGEVWRLERRRFAGAVAKTSDRPGVVRQRPGVVAGDVEYARGQLSSAADIQLPNDTDGLPAEVTRQIGRRPR